MPKKTTRQTKPSNDETAFDPMAEAERRIAEAHQEKAIELVLSSLELRKVPNTLYTLKQLQKLRLHFNQLQKIPANLGELRQLQLLTLGDNELRELPARLGELDQLRELYLFNNQIRALPTSLAKLKRLQRYREQLAASENLAATRTACGLA
jgi:Leucine-rich repeat (LRR) protein